MLSRGYGSRYAAAKTKKVKRKTSRSLGREIEKSKDGDKGKKIGGERKENNRHSANKSIFIDEVSSN